MNNIEHVKSRRPRELPVSVAINVRPSTSIVVALQIVLVSPPRVSKPDETKEEIRGAAERLARAPS